MQAALDGALGHRGRLGGLLDRLALVDDGVDGRPLLGREAELARLTAWFPLCETIATAPPMRSEIWPP